MKLNFVVIPLLLLTSSVVAADKYPYRTSFNSHQLLSTYSYDDFDETNTVIAHRLMLTFKASSFSDERLMFSCEPKKGINLFAPGYVDWYSTDNTRYKSKRMLGNTYYVRGWKDTWLLNIDGEISKIDYTIPYEVNSRKWKGNVSESLTHKQAEDILKQIATAKNYIKFGSIQHQKRYGADSTDDKSQWMFRNKSDLKGTYKATHEFMKRCTEDRIWF